MKIVDYNVEIDDQFIELIKQNYATSTVLPSYPNLWRAFELTPLAKVKVVIIGQDPYPTIGDATGLAFSVDESSPLPRSLVNMFKLLKKDTGIERELGDLSD